MDYKDICVTDKQVPVHQLNKLNEKGTKREDFFPISVVQAIFDKTGIRLDAIISSFNYLFLPWKGTKADTRLQVVGLMRRKSLVVCYRDLNDETTIEMYNSNERGNDEWKKDDNWIGFAEWIEDVIQNIFNNLDEYPDIETIINNAVNKWLTENVGDTIDQIINEYIESVDIDSIIDQSIQEWINNNQSQLNQYFNQVINQYLEDNLEDLVGEFFGQIVTYLRDNERVIANALARHEQAITDLQNTSTETT